MDIGYAFAMSVLRQPGRVALVEGPRRMTYAAWYSEIKAVAGGLEEMGLRLGDHLVVVMRNRYEMATLYWASHMLGLIFTPVSWRASADEIRYCFEDADAAAVAFDGASGDAPMQAAAALDLDPNRVIVVADGKGGGRKFSDLLDARPIAGSRGVDEFSICLMLYTSGTTGRPKGVPRSHRNELAASIAHIAQELGIDRTIPVSALCRSSTPWASVFCSARRCSLAHSFACRTMTRRRFSVSSKPRE